MLIVTIVIPDTGESAASEAADRLTDLADELGGHVLQAHVADEDQGDMEIMDATPVRGPWT